MWKDLVARIMALVRWAEQELKGKTGAEKRNAVIDKAVALINFPFVPDWIETPIERIVYGYLIDQGCRWFNVLGDGSFVGLILSNAQQEKVVEMIDMNPEEVIPPELIAEGASVDEKLNALYAKYAEAK
jgi:hypothetical protein